MEVWNSGMKRLMAKPLFFQIKRSQAAKSLRTSGSVYVVSICFMCNHTDSASYFWSCNYEYAIFTWFVVEKNVKHRWFYVRSNIFSFCLFYFYFENEPHNSARCVKRYKMHRMAADSYMNMTKMPSTNSCTAVYRKMNKTSNLVQKPYSPHLC